MNRIIDTIMPHKTIIRLSGVARNPANGFPARLLADARSPDRCFDQVLVYKMSRLSRDLADYQGIMSELRESGVTVVSVSDPGVSSPMERLIESFIQAVNDHYREGHSQATR